MLPTLEDGSARYSSNGLVMVKKVYEGVTKQYIEKGYSKACPNGLTYEEFFEVLSKVTPIGTWMEWKAIVKCI